MADISNLVIAVNTSQVSAADVALDRLAKAASDATAAVARMTAAATANASQAGNVAKQVMTAANAHNTLAAAATRATSAHHAHGAAMGNSRTGALELEHSVRAITDALAAGANPVRVLSMEFSRLAEAASMAGGAGNMLKGALSMYAPMFTALMSPIGLATGAIVGFGAAGLYAFDAWQQRLNALQQALNGLGRSSGLTIGGLNQLAMSSIGGRTSSAQAAEAITAYTATGRISPEMQARLTSPQPGFSEGVTQQYARSTGQSFSESVKMLAADFADPTKGAAELNKEFGLLGDNEMQLIVHMDAAGNRFGAQGKLLDDLQARIQNAADVTSIWARAWGGVSTAASSALAGIGRALSPSMEDELAALATKNRPGGANIEYGNLRRPISPADTAREQTIRQILARNAEAAYFQGIDQTAKEKSIDIGEITRHTNPDIYRLQKLTDDRDKLQKAMDTPGALGMTDRNAAQEALDRLNAGVKNFGTTAQIVARDSAAASAATMATTATQRTAIQAMAAWNDAVREGGGYALAAAESTAKWSAALAETKKALDDETRTTARSTAEIGMNPIQRAQYEALGHGADWSREHVSGIAPSYARAQQGAAVSGSVSAPAPVGGFSAPNPAAYPVSQAGQAAFIRDYAAFAGGGRGVALPVAMGVANAEGLRAITPQNPNGGSTIDRNPDGTPFSFGAFQLNVRNGLGNSARAAGIDPANPAQANLANKFAMDSMATGGLGPWRGDAYVKSMGGAGGFPTIGMGASSPAGWPQQGTSAAVLSAQQHAMNTQQITKNIPTSGLDDLLISEQKSLDAANRSLQAQMDTWLQMPAAIAEAATKAKLLNQEIAAGITPTQQILDANQKLATQSGAQAQSAANFSQLTQTVGQVQDMAKSITTGAASDFASAWGAKPQNIVSQLSVKDQKAYYSGKMSGQDVKNRVMMNQVWDLTRQEASKFGVGLIEKGIFGSGSGANATPGLLSPLFSAGGSALGGLFGMGGGAAAGGASGGSFAGLSSLLGGSGPNPFAFALGGVMTPSGPRRLPMFASGGTSSGAAIFGEGGPEAAVPLPDGRAIPVAFKKATFGGGAGAVVNHHYNTVQGGDINIAGNADEKILPQMRAEMAASNKAMMDQLNRNIGVTTAKWSQRFGNN